MTRSRRRRGVGPHFLHKLASYPPHHGESVQRQTRRIRPEVRCQRSEIRKTQDVQPRLAQLKFTRCPHLLTASLAATPVRLGPFYVAHPIHSIDSLVPTRLICYPRRLDRPSRSFPRLGSLVATLAALPSISLFPNAPFPHSRRVLCRSFR